MEKIRKYKGWKCGMCYEQNLKINKHQCFLSVTKNAETWKGYIFDDMESMQNVLDLLALGHFWVNKKAQLQMPACHKPFSHILVLRVLTVLLG